MAANGVKSSSDNASAEKTLMDALGFRVNGDGKLLKKGKLRKLALHRKDAETNGAVKGSAPATVPSSPIIPHFDHETMENFPSGEQEPLETVWCKHCKKVILRRTAKDHISGCLKSKLEKARKKKEAREAAARAKERAERGDDDDDEDDDVKDGKGRKNGLNGDVDGKGKKRKADADDDKDSKKKKKKEEQKPKAAKPKGPVDVERQCGVNLPNGQQCARSLTCKSHSMGAKRAVPGRSLPYDMLLAAYQKKNQARQQKAAIDANAPLLYEDELDSMAGPVDSDEERDAVMTAISRSISRPQPLVTRTLFPTRRKYQLVRMKEMLSNALTGNRNLGGIFAVPSDSARTGYGSSAANDHFAIPSAAASSVNPAIGMSQSILKPLPRKMSVDVM